MKRKDESSSGSDSNEEEDEDEDEGGNSFINYENELRKRNN
jgi:hypothetical protein